MAAALPKLNIHTGTLDFLELSKLVTKYGYCVVSGVNTELDFVNLCQLLGPIQYHERSKQNGVVDVTSDPRVSDQNPELFRGLGMSNFEPHSDGAFLDNLYQTQKGVLKHVSPPSMLVLRCVCPAASGGESLLVDCSRIFHDLKGKDEELLQIMHQPIFHFLRDGGAVFPSQAPVFKGLKNGNIMCRYRSLVAFANGYQMNASETKLQDAFQKFTEKYILNTKFHIRFKLLKNEILVVDNFRMLHGRTKFSVLEGQHRHLQRLWIADDTCQNRLDNSRALTISHPLSGEKLRGLENFAIIVMNSDSQVAKSYTTETVSKKHCDFNPILGIEI